jgi:glycine betaine/proline transport system substrate-binding protein
MKHFFQFNKFMLSLVVLVTFIIGILGTPAMADLPGKGVTVRPVYNGIVEELFQHEVIFIGLERLGYKVAPIMEVEITTMHIAVGQGSADFCASHWDPLQTAMYTKGGGDKVMEKVGVLADGALQGYLIDKKTAEKHGIKSLDQFKDPKVAEIFDTDGDGKADLTGCNPGWGCERSIEHHLKAYDLSKTVRHNQGSYFALIADTISRYKDDKPIFYYTWTPLWVSGLLVPDKDVVWLTVPFTSLPGGGEEDAITTLPDGRNLGFSVNKIRVMARKDFLKANPAAKRFFELVKVPINDISAENGLIRDGEKKPEDIRRHAEEWVAKHQAEFDGWVKEALKAGQ